MGKEAGSPTRGRIKKKPKRGGNARHSCQRVPQEGATRRSGRSRDSASRFLLTTLHGRRRRDAQGKEKSYKKGGKNNDRGGINHDRGEKKRNSNLIGEKKKRRGLFVPSAAKFGLKKKWKK